ncbi:hypothetical protein [Salinilacihabitans rarus]|uniref:hypothetical protein n=1 Tax=Salinilacihabitans rarus TaxID=2961596 RepID=UPI0020C84106|nr:hypothetical protein [Salinilacihabitans rarus]
MLAAVGAVGLTGPLAGYASADGGSGPEVASLEVIDRSNPPWVWYRVRWDVTSGDADLATARSELLHDGAVVDSRETSVSGSRETGAHRIRTKGEADTVRFLAFDEEGRLGGRVFDADDPADEGDGDETDGGDTDGSGGDGESDSSGTGGSVDDAEDDGEDGDGNESDGTEVDAVENATEANSDGDENADGSPGPGAFTALASITGTGYLLARLRRDDTER